VQICRKGPLNNLNVETTNNLKPHDFKQFTTQNVLSRRSKFPKWKIYLGFNEESFCIACTKYRASFLRVFLGHLNSNVHPCAYWRTNFTQRTAGPQNAGPEAIAIFATFVNPALDITVHVCDCIYSGIQVSLVNKNANSYVFNDIHKLMLGLIM